jgi:hemin uptake protein HemP
MNDNDRHNKIHQSGDATQVSSASARRISIGNNRLDSRDLFVGTREIDIVHGNDTYHLRLTAQNKLILTK